VYAREFKGPVTALSTLDGSLLLATGNRLETCSLVSTTTVDTSAAAGGVATTTTYKLQRTAFYDGPQLVSALSVVKSFALLGDVQHGLQFLRWRDEGKQLGLLAKDFGSAPIAVAQFLVAGSSLHLVAADAAGTLRAYTYAPNDPGSWKGQKLLAWGAFHLGDRPGAMLRARSPAASPGDQTPRQAVLYGTDAGGVGVLVPLALATPLDVKLRGDPAAAPVVGAAAALKALHDALLSGAAHTAGLNPAAFRRRYARIPAGLQGGRPYGRQLALGAQGVLDGDALLEYVCLPRAAQLAVAQRAGVQRDQVLQALATIARSSVLF
jgi:cleavage and polyadenylation specificity factor subunit 1